MFPALRKLIIVDTDGWDQHCFFRRKDCMKKRHNPEKSVLGSCSGEDGFCILKINCSRWFFEEKWTKDDNTTVVIPTFFLSGNILSPKIALGQDFAKGAATFNRICKRRNCLYGECSLGCLDGTAGVGCVLGWQGQTFVSSDSGTWGALFWWTFQTSKVGRPQPCMRAPFRLKIEIPFPRL
jgi:hypothetical protein